MIRTIQILNRVFAVEFYKLNSAFFLLVTGFSFGFMRGIEHKALAQFFIASPVLLLIPVSCWFIYMFKIIQFNNTALRIPQNEFVFYFCAFNRASQWLYIIPVLFNQLVPVIAYAIFLMMMAVQHSMILPVAYISLAILFLIFAGTASFIYHINHPNREKKIGMLKRFLDANFSKPYFQFFIAWITRSNVATLVGTKLFSCLLLWGIISLYSTDVYDSRLLAMGVAVAFSGNVMLVYYVHQFENLHFTILRNLPIPLWKRLCYFILTFIILCLPELGLLINNFPEELGFISCASIVAFGLSIGTLYYAYLYQSNMMLDRFVQHVFGITLFSIVMILFAIPIWFIAMANLVTGVILFRKYYYTFEFFAHNI